MYCGHPIPDGHKLSKSEKVLIRSKKAQEADEQRAAHEKFMAKRKELMRKAGG